MKKNNEEPAFKPFVAWSGQYGSRKHNKARVVAFEDGGDVWGHVEICVPDTLGNDAWVEPRNCGAEKLTEHEIDDICDIFRELAHAIARNAVKGKV